jgi:hypothetical protein
MRERRIDAYELAVGMSITVHWPPRGHSGQGGVVTEIGPAGFTLQTPVETMGLHWSQVHHFTVEHPFELEECIEYDPDTCRGTVDYFSPDGRGSAPPRCEHHVDQRIKLQEDSLMRYAYSDVAPDWFDPADAGEHWRDD